MTLALSFKAPEEIRPDEVILYWEELSEQTPHGCYKVYLSPNRVLKAWVLKEDKRVLVASMWDRYTGHVYQEDREAWYPLVSKLGGWI